MAKLWDKGSDLHALMEAFTVGEDYALDARLVNGDCVASMAHAEMLGSIGLLKPEEVGALKRELSSIIELHAADKFAVSRAEEDVHTAIENRLTAVLGDVGKKIHTGRSRNDQVIAALRLWTRGFLFAFQRACLSLAEGLLGMAEAHAGTPMPGRTHMQLAMPSSVGLWAAAYAEELLDDARLAHGVFPIVDSCPLGSAASYGVPLPLDREMTSTLLGFSKLQNNVLYAHNSRGKFESIVLGAVEQAGLTLSRMSQDLILFSMPEFGYFTLPAELCTGSSIMPQKKNPDGLEIIRAKSALISSDRAAVAAIVRALPSGYNRDLQETKGPFFRACENGLACLRVMALTVSKLSVNTKKLLAAFTPEIFATDRALELAAGGTPFRDAYREVGKNLDKLKGNDPVDAILKKKSVGATGNLNLGVARAALLALREEIGKEEELSRSRISELAGTEVELFRDPLPAAPEP
jgi:argininosuccinate lyase